MEIKYVADELPDEFIKLLKQSIKEKEKSDTVLIGEVWKMQLE